MNEYSYKVEADQAMENGAMNKALDLYSKALKIDPYNPVIWSDRGVCFFNNKQFEKSLNDLNKSVELDPENPYRYSSRAFVKGALKDVKGAVIDYEKALELDPDDAICRNNLGLMQEKLSYWNQAKKNFEVADELAGILKDRNIITESSAKIIVDNPIESSKEETILDEVKSVFTSRSKFSEFLKFIKNGFKLD